jgi:hypothetical protein
MRQWDIREPGTWPRWQLWLVLLLLLALGSLEW